MEGVMRAIARHFPIDILDLCDLQARFPGVALTVDWPEGAAGLRLVVVPHQSQSIPAEQGPCPPGSEGKE